jgi:hypothetical protein
MQLECPIPYEELVHFEPLEQIHRVLAALRSEGVELPAEIDSQAENLLALWEINARAAQRYVPQPYSGRVTLFVAEENADINPTAVAEQVTVWRELSDREPNVIHLSTSHQAMLLDQASVSDVATHMQAFLDQVRRGPGPSES